MSSGDMYDEAIDYIKQIEKEIVFSLDEDNLDELTNFTNINAYCDILLNKISKELCITSKFEEKIDLNSSLNISDKCNYIESNQNVKPITSCQADNQNSTYDNQVDLKLNKNSLPVNFDKDTNYRYSFYDNSNKLSVYLAHSSLIEALTNDNAIPDDKDLNDCIFGCNPNLIQKKCNGLVLPDFIENALLYLSQFGLNSIGLFRKSGVKSRINNLKEQIKNGTDVDFSSLCVYDVADLVKSWLRDLRPHLISKKMIDSFISKKEEFSLWHLNDSHRYLLFVILNFLIKVSSYSKQNQMTTHNLAICFTPSLCECETESEILNAQKCLEYCIENHESLFYLTLDPSMLNIEVKLNSHTASAIVNASAQDILNRLIYERNSVDPLITEWSMKKHDKNSDIFELNQKFSWLLPPKTFLFHRVWTVGDNHAITLNENADFFKSTWNLRPNRQGQTEVIHKISLDLRGFSRKWYESVYSSIHDNQMKQLALSFELANDSNSKVLISDV